jgi:serine/threonine-protein kinase
VNLEIGTTVGDYQIIGILGAGGMGRVFKVRNSISDRVDAMKVLLPDLTGEPDLADRFLREIKVLAGLEHPNIAGLRTAFRYENQLFMVMEYVEGVTLDQRLREGPLTVEEGVRAIAQVLSALGYAHRRGVIHRDIKPANMMVTPAGVVKLMDFGIAKGEGDRKLTMTGTTMGSLYYMSPEQIRGTQSLDARADLYSVGVSLYELVTGKRPFDGDSQFAIMSAHLEKTPVPPIVHDPRLPQLLNDLILVSVSREPENRFQSAEAFEKALSNVVPATETVPLAAPVPTRPAAAPAVAPAAPQAAFVAPAGPAPPKVAPAPRPAAAASGGKSHRALWAGIGGVCCVAALVAAIQFGPWKKAAADSSHSPAPAPAVGTAPSATPPAPAANPEAVPASAPAAENPPAPAQQAPVQPAPMVKSEPAVKKPVRASAGSPQVQQPVRNASQPPAAQPVQTPPAQQTAPQAAPPAPVPAGPSQAELAARRAELQKVRESLVTMSARAASVHSTLDSVRRSQAATGLGMRGDWLQAASLMDSFLRGSNDALNAGDAAAARDFMDKADRQLTILEKALNK